MRPIYGLLPAAKYVRNLSPWGSVEKAGGCERSESGRASGRQCSGALGWNDTFTDKVHTRIRVSTCYLLHVVGKALAFLAIVYLSV